MLSLETTICQFLHIDVPIIQAGMAGSANAELASAVSSAGALGTLGAAYMSPDQMRDSIKKIKGSTENAFAVNLFCVDMTDDWNGLKQSQDVLDQFRHELGIQRGSNYATPDWFEDQFQVVLDEEVPVISTAFGVLPPDKMEAAKDKGMKVITMVTTVTEAVQAEKSGADLIVAQGSDAGGHRGTFDITKYPDGANIGTFSLVPQIVDNVRVPVIAAGGIMDGRGLVAALALGASGVQLGTAFLPANESVAHPVYKRKLLESTEESTVITKSFSGRPARGIRNIFIKEFEAAARPVAFPSQNTLTSDIRKAAAEQGNPEYMSLWAGQGTRLLRADRGASDIILNIVSEAKELLRIS